MSLIELIGTMNKKDKIYGILPDRFIIDRRAVTRNYAQLALTDHRRDFDFNDFKLDDTFVKNNLCYPSTNYRATGFGDTQTHISRIISSDFKVRVQDRHTPPLFYSSALSGFRDYQGSGIAQHINSPLNYFKGPDIIFTVDNTGNVNELYTTFF